MKKTFWIARQSVSAAFYVFNVKPTERLINIHTANISFPNISYYPIVAGLYGLDKFLSVLNMPIGACWEIEVDECDDKFTVTIVDKDVYVETKASNYRYKDRS